MFENGEEGEVVSWLGCAEYYACVGGFVGTGSAGEVDFLDAGFGRGEEFLEGEEGLEVAMSFALVLAGDGSVD